MIRNQIQDLKSKLAHDNVLIDKPDTLQNAMVFSHDDEFEIMENFGKRKYPRIIF